MNSVIVSVGITVVLLLLYFKKESFQTVQQELVEDTNNYDRSFHYTNQVTRAQKNNDILTKTDFQNIPKCLLLGILLPKSVFLKNRTIRSHCSPSD